MSDENTPRKPFLDLSLTQLIGGSAAAATAAALGSRLGLVGTIVGAGVVSVISAIAGAVYTQSLRRTQEMIRARELIGARELMIRAGQRTGALTMPPRPAGRESGVERDGEPEDDDDEAALGTDPPAVWRRVTWKTVLVTAVVVFLIAGIVITATELLAGRSLDGSKGTTVSNVVHGEGHTSRTPAPTPSTGTTGNPSGSGSSVPTETPSTTTSPSESPTTTPTTTPTDEPTTTATPTAGSSGAADGETSASATPTP